MDKTYIHSCHTFNKSWNDDSHDGLRKLISKGQRLITVHVGGEMGFIKNSYLKFKSNLKTIDYHSQMNFQNYKKWLVEILIPNLPAQSVLAIDNATYHNVQSEKNITTASKKDEIKEWLRKKTIPFRDDMLGAELYTLAKFYQPHHKSNELDKLLEENRHSVLRLPPYHHELNPIELVWASIKNYVAQRNVSFNFKDVEILCDQFFETFSEDEWKSRCENAKHAEQFFMKSAPAVDLITEKVIINLDDDDDDDNDDDDSDSEDDLEDTDSSSDPDI
ncbi:uncharacterized protein [Diabrotica undecimpunctata]|uniref:uncharacterized protein n=1 Tax=Diabrotica undecimpunctata TaxID=50387 RepID=UPI003B635A3C